MSEILSPGGFICWWIN